MTGCAGFIGYHVCQALLARGEKVAGIDNLNRYYNVSLKHHRLSALLRDRAFEFRQLDLASGPGLDDTWRSISPTHVVHLAAQAGVRHSLTNPGAYIRANVVAFQNVLELVRETEPDGFVYASSSSVYGASTEFPLSEDLPCAPINLYAATKLSNEQVAKAYGSLFGLPSTGLRFFTVYGPMGRPDMAMWKFAKAMLAGEPIDLYNGGQMTRDFTYIDDIVDGILRALDRPEVGAVYNLGNSSPVGLGEVVGHLESALGVTAERRHLPHQLGDVQATLADCSRARRRLGYEPKIDVAVGIRRFAEWYQDVGHRY